MITTHRLAPTRGLLAVLLILVQSYALVAQEPEERYQYSVVDSIDCARVECHYRYSFAHGEIRRSGVSILQIGEHLTKFVESQKYYSDSLGHALKNKLYTRREIDMAKANVPKGQFNYQFWVLFDNYPAGQTSITERILGDHYISQEPRELPRWEIVSDSTKSIMGYDCTLATTELHGRKWHVWFAPRVAMPYGPWLLRGLPGLVVEAYDTDREHDFLLLEVLRKSSPIIMSRQNYMKAPRERVIQRRIHYYRSPRSVLIEQGIISERSNLPAMYHSPYNPIRRLPSR